VRTIVDARREAFKCGMRSDLPVGVERGGDGLDDPLQFDIGDKASVFSKIDTVELAHK